MEEVFTDLASLGASLARAQARRESRVAFRQEADLSLPQLHRALDMLLPMVQRLDIAKYFAFTVTVPTCLPSSFPFLSIVAIFLLDTDHCTFLPLITFPWVLS